MVNPTAKDILLNEQLIKIVEFSELENLTSSILPPLTECGTQIKLIKELLLGESYKCNSIVFEEQYIDKAFSDEFREFYGSSFISLSNTESQKRFSNNCSRLHFFSPTRDELEDEIKKLHEMLQSRKYDRQAYSSACRIFSSKYYLGFMVLKPIENTRVGRTVLKHPEGLQNTKFNCTRHYSTHLLGIELFVCGLPFQQQDGGVSACASTATWSSLHQVNEFEHFHPQSPASITTLATKQVLPFGRAIPQENGLSVDQMCQAIHAVGLSPYLLSFENLKVQKIKSLLYSAVRSGFAPILIIKRLYKEERHAITVAGMVNDSQNFVPESLSNISLTDTGWKLSSLFVNDDRLSPYSKVEIKIEPVNNTVKFCVNYENDGLWEVTHLLVPLHNKIRFALDDLHEFAVKIADNIVGRFKLKTELEQDYPTGFDVEIETWISKEHEYKRHLFFGNDPLSVSANEALNYRISLPRYVGIVRLKDSSFGVIDVLIDTTHTSRHVKFLLVLGRANNSVFSSDLVMTLSKELKCPYLIDKQITSVN